MCCLTAVIAIALVPCFLKDILVSLGSLSFVPCHFANMVSGYLVLWSSMDYATRVGLSHLWALHTSLLRLNFI